MARPWSDVVADPNFKALAPDAQEQARNAYFQQTVLPNIPPDANASAIRLQFDQQTVPTLKPQSSPTSYDAAEFKRRVGRDPENSYELAQFAGRKGEGFAGAPTRFTAGQAAVGALEDATTLGTGFVASIPAAATYLGSGGNLEAAKKVQGALTYAPRSDAGQAGMQGIGEVMRGPGEVAKFAADKVDPTGNLSATLSDLGERASIASGVIPGVAALRGGLARTAVSTVKRAGNAVVGSIRDPEAAAATAQDVLNAQAASAPQNMGAAAAAPRVTGANPELQQAIVREARKNGGAVNIDAVERQLQADRVGVKLTEGQATREAPLFSEEQNLRGKLVDLADHFNEQNKNLVNKVQDLREQIGPDVHSTNAVEHGDTLISAYEDMDAARNADIKGKYQALRDAAGGNFPVDAKTLLENSRAALQKELLTHDAPPGIMRTLGDLADSGHMTFEQFENLRTNLARVQRNFATDGNTRFAAGIIRDQMEQLPLEPGAATLKPLADAARAAARDRFQALEADPAYKAAVNGTVAPDKFVKKFVIGGNRDDVATMAQNLAGNDTARQTMSVAVLDHLRDKAGIGPDYKGALKQFGYNKALTELDPKLHSLVDPRTAETFRDIGDVAHNIQVAPPGSTVNSSNTLSAGMADYAGGVVEHAVNAQAGGLPIGTLGRKVIQKV
ncbi:MAG: hypothetical protein JWP44_4848, partial [Mucilaginibacter sp.]|nr:hypothetical protein [Mucilaginibacter sp.]